MQKSCRDIENAACTAFQRYAVALPGCETACQGATIAPARTKMVRAAAAMRHLRETGAHQPV
jgi:hypothetical protein